MEVFHVYVIQAETTNILVSTVKFIFCAMTQYIKNMRMNKFTFSIEITSTTILYTAIRAQAQWPSFISLTYKSADPSTDII